MGWPALVSGNGGWKMLANDVRDRIFGNRRCVLIASAWCGGSKLFMTDQAHGRAHSCLGVDGTIDKALHVGASDSREGTPDL